MWLRVVHGFCSGGACVLTAALLALDAYDGYPEPSWVWSEIGIGRTGGGLRRSCVFEEYPMFWWLKEEELRGGGASDLGTARLTSTCGGRRREQ